MAGHANHDAGDDNTTKAHANGSTGAGANRDDRAEAPQRKPAWRTLLPDWAVDNLTQPRSWRIWFRCWLSAWAGFVLMIPQSSLRVLGQAAFFASMISFMAPPNMPLVISLMLYAIIGLGACFGWAWGVAAMAAANAARDQTVNQQRLVVAQQGIAGTTNPEAQFQAVIFSGRFLDTKSSAVHGVFLMLLAYLCGVVQVKLPKLKMGVIFTLIIADIFGSYGPLFPFPRYTLGTLFMIPLGCGVAIALATQLLVFPETLNYAWQLQLLKLIGLNAKLLEQHQSALDRCAGVLDASLDASAQASAADVEAFQRLAKQGEDEIASIARSHEGAVRPMQLGTVQLAGALADQAPMLELEASYSRLSGKDLRTFVLPIRKLSVRLLSLNAFWKHLCDESGIHAADQYRTDQYDDDGAAAHQWHRSDFDEKRHLRPARVHESQTMRRLRHRVLKAEAEQHVSLVSLVRILASVTAAPVAANRRALASVLTYFSTVANWKKSPTFEALIEELYESQRDLEKAKEQLLSDERMKLLQPYIDHFRASGGRVPGGERDRDGNAAPAFLDTHISILQLRIGGRPFFVSLVFVTNLFDVIDSTLALQRHTIDMAERRGAKNRLWMPTGLRSIWKVLSGKKGAQGLSKLSSDHNNNDGFERTEELDDDIAERRGPGGGRDAEEGSFGSTRSSLRHYSSDDDEDDDEDDEDGADGSDVHRRRTASTATRDEEKAAPGKGPAKKRGANKHASAAERRRYHDRDPDALPPSGVLQRVGRALGAVYYFAWSPASVYGLRNVVATFAIWIITVVPSSAGFAYQNRAIWALIMAQTGLALHGGELIFSLSLRLVGTVLGLLAGMVIWYCSTGSGNGNPYGIGAATAVGFVPLIFIRAFAPMTLLLPALMLGVTTVLIVGYSWIDSHLPVLANSGIGVDVAWRRALLVLIGMGVAFAVMIFPRLTSTRSLVRMGFARNTREINTLWCMVIEKWLSTTRQDLAQDAASGFRNVVAGVGTNAGSGDDEQTNRSANGGHAGKASSAGTTPGLSAAIRGQFVGSHMRLATLMQQIGLASVDLQLRGRWPKERYLELASIHSMLLESLMQLYISVDALQVTSELGSANLGVDRPEQHEAWRRRLVQDTGFLYPQFISEVCLTLDLLGKSLRSGERLSHCQFGLLENLARYSYLTRIVSERQRQAARSATVGGAAGGGADAVDDELVTLESLKDPLFMRYITASMSVLTLAAQLDRFREVVKDLVGQVPLPGFDRHRDEFGERAQVLFQKS
ncbi:uncharacterized protein PFL1_06799 [Pseudozyma flocculosa PF-1]|uniref:ER transporter 6TM N-terminal domain-containing protein n=2 Tax=Pseudozyma flocculosa TaxID=84751 RepID=A0A5C3FF12_9BASI|nr:uncharacterized protein PFL1_06799 [Pseudozyma flocculosa PF-1]EPQ25662.1 hypothetical protein PFL1_06799 [Pseudozyma flocculosa PF-1]SPO42071.1 uncharacterized protein PSFLO_07554 [Pseudozyma flocculosa]